jgi:hypothetical protein
MESMFSDEIIRIHAELGALAGKLDDQDWQIVRQARIDLEALRVLLEAFEHNTIQIKEECS